MIRIALACAALLAPQIARAGEWTVRIHHVTHPLSRPVCEEQGWPNADDPTTVAKTKAVAENYLWRLQKCGFLDARTFNVEKARIAAAEFRPVCTRLPDAPAQHFGSAEVRVVVTWWGPECPTP